MNPQLVGGIRFHIYYEIGCRMNCIVHQGVRLIGRAAYLKCTQSQIPAVLPFGYRISCTYAPRHFEDWVLPILKYHGVSPGCTHTGDDLVHILALLTAYMKTPFFVASTHKKYKTEVRDGIP